MPNIIQGFITLNYIAYHFCATGVLTFLFECLSIHILYKFRKLIYKYRIIGTVLRSCVYVIDILYTVGPINSNKKIHETFLKTEQNWLNKSYMEQIFQKSLPNLQI